MTGSGLKIVPAHKAGFVAIAAAGAAFFICPALSIVLLLLYVLLCVGACFFPGTNFLGPAISRGPKNSGAVSLTFDDGPSEPVTRRILDLLDQYAVKATFFVSGQNALRHPDLLSEIVRRGHAVGNHSFSHDPFVMLKGSRTIYREIDQAQKALGALGVWPLVFRPPVGIVNPMLFGILDNMGLTCVTFNRRACDAGNRRLRNLSRKILSKLQPGDILLMHDTVPRQASGESLLYAEVDAVLRGISAAGLKIVPLADLIGIPVMKVDV